MSTVHELVKLGAKQVVRGVNRATRTVISLPFRIADVPKDLLEGGRHLENKLTAQHRQLKALASQFKATDGSDAYLITSSSPQLHIIGPGIGSPENVALTRQIHTRLASTETGSELLRDLRDARAQGYNIRLGVADSLHGNDVGGTLYDAEGGVIERYQHCDKQTGRLKPGTYNLVLSREWMTKYGSEPTSVAAHEMGHAHLGITSGKYDRAALADPANAGRYVEAEEHFVIEQYENPIREELGLERRKGLSPVKDR